MSRGLLDYVRHFQCQLYFYSYILSTIDFWCGWVKFLEKVRIEVLPEAFSIGMSRTFIERITTEYALHNRHDLTFTKLTKQSPATWHKIAWNYRTYVFSASASS